ncbi:hypothetical protein NBO_11g0060 [Nosema bombycis CQ1]|uniref:Uncharacterized protein n=1 Tax=Nosema bombycis (strain CQ1 / CVCC 102059) TaxID=578461 RepID=R0MAK9_NOSB1|nr:hypothetical protein NBO_11g0060 [Nosema bombycis CQ1]|eukprot:EOB14989.1 hypothetical protein NBO_11g0060 [Nosema bombycis CQ1]
MSLTIMHFNVFLCILKYFYAFEILSFLCIATVFYQYFMRFDCFDVFLCSLTSLGPPHPLTFTMTPILLRLLPPPPLPSTLPHP